MWQYRTAVPIASGGVGEVLKAWDDRRQCWVAMKILMRHDPVTVERFAREATTQSRLDHPNICKVHEVTQDESGRTVLVLQYIDGKPLDVAAESMPLEERIRVLKTAAEAVHFAHAAGVSHRDLKPGNILVERLEDGSTKPYIVDFGLAGVEDSNFLTRTGEVLGTPAFMAPEQARGDIRNIDRRTDVYALGAILFLLLTGRPPFEASTPVDLLAQIIDREPPNPSRIDPGIPDDLAVIVLACLQKEPRHRIDSAQAFADELGRWLEGKSIKTRPLGKFARLLRLIRRRPVASAAIALAFLALAIGAAIAIAARIEARDRMVLARDLGAQEERLAARIRFIHMLPLHNITRELNGVRTEMSAIERRIAEFGPVAEGPGHAALGRTHLALGNFEEARRHLERAMQSGFDRLEVRTALGRTLASIYRTELTEASREKDGELRRLRIERAQKNIRDPALELLENDVEGSTSESTLVRASIALLEDRFDDAVVLARSSIADEPWRYQARLISGDALFGRALKTGEDNHEATLDGFSEASKEYQRAIEIASSDPLTHLRLCDLADTALGVLLHENARGFDHWHEIAVASCTNSVVASPSLVTAHLRLSSAHTAKARLQYSLGQDSARTLDSAIEAAEEGVAVAPESSDAYRTLGNARLYLAFAQEKRGINPDPIRHQAIESLERALELDPNNVGALNSLGLIHIDTINAARDHGFDPIPSIEAGIDLFTRAAELLPDYTHAHSNLGIVYRLRGEHELRLGHDPTASIELAIQSYQRAIEINPAYTYAYNNLGNVFRLAGKVRIAHGEAPDREIESALEKYAEASRRNPDWAFPYLNSGIAHRLVARYLIEHEGDPKSQLDLAREDLRKGIEILGDHPLAWVELAEVELAAADDALGRNRSPQPALKATEKAVRRSLALDPSFSEAHRLRGEIELIRARRLLQTGDSPEAALRRARTALERSFELNHRTTATSLALARLASMEASRTDGARAAALIAEALDHAERVLELNPGNNAARRLLNELSSPA